MRTIIQSIHSQVPETIADLGKQPDLIISLDSHLDVSLGGDEALYPSELRTIAARTGAHAAIRKTTGGLANPKGTSPRRVFRPRLIVAIPHLMLARHAAEIESSLPASVRLHDPVRSIASVAEFLAKSMGIEIYESPPKPLSRLASVANGRRPWILDIDVDYIHEMRKECYTQIRGAKPGVLQSMSSVVRFIQVSRPETVILSEAMASAIRDRGSNFSKLIAELRAMGYEVEEKGVFAADAEALRGIAVCKAFYRTVSKDLMVRHMPAMMRGDFTGFMKVEAAAAKSFFRSKGYAV